METLVIQQGDSARIELVLPIDKMAQVEDVVCTVGNRLSYSLSKGTLTPTATSNIFHLDILSVQSQKHTGNLEVVVAIDYSDIGVKKTKRAENLVVQVVRNENYFNNNSISELVSAVVVVTVEEDVVTSIPILASYLVINGGGGGATNLGYTPSPTNGIVTSDTGTDATIPLANNTNAGLLSSSEKTAITHANRTTLDLITEAFTTSLKNGYDSSVSILSSLLATGVRLITSTEITTLTNTTGTNSGDETITTIQTKRPIKTIEGQSLEGTGNIDLSKSDVGLGNVDNTSDLLKPISTATQTALNAKQNTLTAGTNITIVGDTISASGGGGAVDSVNEQTGVVVLDAMDVGAIPLTGTEVGSPVTGDIEFNINGSNRYIKSINADENIYSQIAFGIDGIQVMASSFDQPVFTSFTAQKDKVLIQTNNINCVGILGSDFFDKQNDQNAFAQLGDIPTIDENPTNGSNNPVSSNGVFDALNTKQNTLTAGTNITIVGDTISASGGGGGITGSGASGQVSFWDGATSIDGDNTLLLDVVNKKLELNCETNNALRGIVVNQVSNSLGAAVITFTKARGTIASPQNANNGDLIGAFVFKSRLSGAYTQDRSLFGSNVVGNGQGMFFCTGTSDGSYQPALYLHPSRNVVIGSNQDIISGITDSGFRLDINGSLRVQSSVINFANLPTSNTGLSVGNLWRDGEIVKVKL